MQGPSSCDGFSSVLLFQDVGLEEYRLKVRARHPQKKDRRRGLGACAAESQAGTTRTARTTGTRKALVSAIFFVSLMSLVSLKSLLSQSLGHQHSFLREVAAREILGEGLAGGELELSLWLLQAL
jgi:hypothetical protein